MLTEFRRVAKLIPTLKILQPWHEVRLIILCFVFTRDLRVTFLVFRSVEVAK